MCTSLFSYIEENIMMDMIPVIVFDDDSDKIVDEYFNTLPPPKTTKMLKQTDVIEVINDCIDSTKGVIPDSVYALLGSDI